VWSPDGKTVASCTYEGNVRLWEAATGRERRTLATAERGLWRVVFSPDSKVVAGAGFEKVWLWEADTGKGAPMDAPETYTNQCWGAAFSHDGRALATSWNRGLVLLWDVVGRRLVHKFEGNEYQAKAVAFSPDDKVLAVAGGSAPDVKSSIRLWDLVGGKVRGVLEGHQGCVSSVDFCPDGGMLASGSWDGTTRLWSAATGKDVRLIKSWASCVAFSPDGQILYSGDHLGVIHGWNAADGKEVGQFRVGVESVKTLSISPDGKMLATAGGDHRIGLWKVPSGEELLPRSGHKSAVLSVVYSPDGDSLASRGGDGTVRMWDVKTCKQVRCLETGGPDDDQGERNRSLVYSPDGRTLAALGTYVRVGPFSNCAVSVLLAFPWLSLPMGRRWR
jgi:WD40 repeat protein